MRAPPITGPLLALLGGAILLVDSLRAWYEVDLARIPGGLAIVERYARSSGYATSANAWEPWGLLSDVLLFAVIAAAIGLGLAGLTIWRERREAALAVLAAGITGTILTALHAIAEPQPREIITVQPAAWLGVVCCLVILAGGGIWSDRLLHGAPARDA